MQSIFLSTKRFLLIIVASMCLGMFLIFKQIPDNKMHVYFLDVGQGDSILIKTPQNHQILIDGGRYGKVINELGEVIPFFDKSIDMVLVTHPDADHIGGLVEVLKRYEVDHVVLTGIQDKSPIYKELLTVILDKNINVIFADAEGDFYFGDVFFDVLYPFDSIIGKRFANSNNTSIVMQVIYGDDSILLTGDAEIESEKELVLAYDLKSDILKAGHHGSNSSSTIDFLNAVSPKAVVVQSGKNNSYGHPKPEVLRNFYRANIEKIYRTDLDGRIEFILPLSF